MKSILTFLFSILAVTGLQSANPAFQDFYATNGIVVRTNSNKVSIDGMAGQRAAIFTNDGGKIHLSTNVTKIGFNDTNDFLISDTLDNFGIGNLTGTIFRFGVENTHVGVRSGTVTHDGSDNTGTGFRVLEKNTDGSNNTGDGAGALQLLVDGNANTAGGKETLGALVSGSDNTGYGYNVLDNSQNGERNSGFGRESFHFLVDCVEVTGIGYRSGYQCKTNYATFLGARADDVDFPGTHTNVTAVGWNTKVGQDNTVQLGNELIEKVITPGYYIATNGFASYSTIATNAVGGTGYTNNQVINQVVYINGTGVSVTQKNRAGTTIVPATTFTGTMTILLQPGWAVTAASGLTGTAVPF